MLAFDLFYFLRASLLSYLAFVMGFAVVVTWVWTTFDGAGYVVTWYNVLGVGLLITSAYALYLAAFDVVHWRQKRLAFQRRNAIRRKGT